MVVGIDRAKVDALMTMISKSFYWAIPLNVPFDKIEKKVAPIEKPIKTTVDNANKTTVSTDKQEKSKVEKAIKPVSIKTFGTIKKSSVAKVNKILDLYLDKKGSVDTVVIAVGSNVESFGKERLNVDFRNLEEGKKIKGMVGTQIFIAENEIDALLPSVLMTLNDYQKQKI